MAYFLADTRVGAQPLTDTDTVQNHQLGAIARGKDPVYGYGEFIYLKGVASTAVGDAVIYNNNAGTTTRVVAGSKGVLAWAMSANTASRFGWYQISGVVVATVATAFAAAADLYATATAGTLDDAVVSGDLIAGGVGVTAIGTPSATTALLQVARPSIT